MKTSKKLMKINEVGILSSEIRVFKLVYEQKSINAAARKVGQDQGNISRLITKLEKSMETLLFTRHKTGLTPTTFGTRLYRAINQAQKEFSQEMITSSELSRPIRIGFSPAIGHTHFSEKLISGLFNLNLSPQFILESSIRLVEMIKTRDLDFIIIHNAVKFPGLISKNITTESLVLISLDGTYQKTLLLHPDMLSLERVIHSISYERSWMIKDYFVIANILKKNNALMGIIPESLLGNYSQLKIIRNFQNEGHITALTWPGSVGVDVLRRIDL